MKFTKAIMITGFASLLSTTAMAADTTASVKGLSNGDEVTLTGTVEDFDSRHPFTLRDTSGAVKVDMSSAKSIILRSGQKVTVTGTVDKGLFGGLFGMEIDATNVNVEQGLGETIGKAIDSITGQDAAGSAQTVSIQSLPETGYVKVDGMVEDVGTEKKFTLKDSTGHVDVNIKSDQSASLHKGTEVTVIGYVGKGLLGKNIDATEVDLRSSTTPVAKQ